MAIRGVDVAQYQGEIDWDALKASGVEFALIKATQGVSFVDPQFARNRSEARRVGIAHGFYHFADTTGSAQAQADHFLATVEPLEQGESLALDQEVVALGEAFWASWLTYVHSKAGFPPLGYASLSYFASHGLTDPGNDGAWVAAWAAQQPNPPAGWNFIAVWQNSDSGSLKTVGGGSARVDTDVFNGTVEQFLAYGKPQPTGTPAPPAPVAPAAPPVAVTPSPASPATVTVQPGDSLWLITSRIAPDHNGGHWPVLYHFDGNPQRIGADPNVLHPGEVLADPWASQPATPPIQPAPQASGFVVPHPQPGYATAADAAARRSVRCTVQPGVYHIFNRADGMVALSHQYAPGVALYWINPAQ